MLLIAANAHSTGAKDQFYAYLCCHFRFVAPKYFYSSLLSYLRFVLKIAFTPCAVMEELVQMAKKFREAASRGDELGLSEDELKFYDSLANNESAVRQAENGPNPPRREVLNQAVSALPCRHLRDKAPCP